HAPVLGIPARGTRLKAFRSEDAELACDRRQHQYQRVDGRIGHVVLGGLEGPEVGRHGPQREVDREQAGEGHHYAHEPDDRSARDRIRSVDARSRAAWSQSGACHAFHYAGYLTELKRLADIRRNRWWSR